MRIVRDLIFLLLPGLAFTQYIILDRLWASGPTSPTKYWVAHVFCALVPVFTPPLRRMKPLSHRALLTAVAVIAWYYVLFYWGFVVMAAVFGDAL
jgi:hypothetical protein